MLGYAADDAEERSNADEALARILADVSQQLQSALEKRRLDEIRFVRDDLTRWMPRAIRFPIWERAYSAIEQPELQDGLTADIKSCVSLLRNRYQELADSPIHRLADSPVQRLFGDVFAKSARTSSTTKA